MDPCFRAEKEGVGRLIYHTVVPLGLDKYNHLIFNPLSSLRDWIIPGRRPPLPLTVIRTPLTGFNPPFTE